MFAAKLTLDSWGMMSHDLYPIRLPFIPEMGPMGRQESDLIPAYPSYLFLFCLSRNNSQATISCMAFYCKGGGASLTLVALKKEVNGCSFMQNGMHLCSVPFVQRIVLEFQTRL